MRERLETQPEGAGTPGSAGQRVDLRGTSGVSDNPFAAAAGMQQHRRHWPSIHSARDARPAGELVNVMVSVSENMIGSIYLSDGRLRTTHQKGPATRAFGEEHLQRFNIDLALAHSAFLRESPIARAVDRALLEDPHSESRKEMQSSIHNLRKAWFVEKLQSGLWLPTWAQQVLTPEDLPEIGAQIPNPHRRCVEIISLGPHFAQAIHISRGELVRMTLPAETLTAIGNAVSLAEEEPDVSRRNQIFLDHLEENASLVANWFRRV
jgi:hypothetical protein